MLLTLDQFSRWLSSAFDFRVLLLSRKEQLEAGVMVPTEKRVHAGVSACSLGEDRQRQRRRSGRLSRRPKSARVQTLGGNRQEECVSVHLIASA